MQLTENDFEALEQMDQNANAKLRESDFTKRLLPHLVPRADDNGKRRVDIFVAVAGHPNRMIDVVSDTDASKVLFVVPPLLSPTPMAIRSLQASPATDIGELAAQFEAQISTAHPGAVIDSYVQRLVALNHTPADAISTVYGKMWAMIYKRYNLPLDLLFGEKAELVEKELGTASPTPGGVATPAGKMIDEIDEDDFEPM